MNRIMTIAAASLFASPAFAATGPFFSLSNTDFVVTLGFLLFIGVLLYFKVPTLLMGMLDKRADGIRSELDEAKALREEAQALLASYERRQREVQEQADRIIQHAKEEAELAGEQLKKTLLMFDAFNDVLDENVMLNSCQIFCRLLQFWFSGHMRRRFSFS